ncbi:MAG: hypothetical protein ACE5RJ_02365 [Nitrosopumilaceae archaeon]
MQEIALFLSSIAGAASAVAYKKFPKNKTELVSIGASPQIKNQINSLKLEQDILTKTISRLYQSDAGLTKIQRDKLLLRYQHQLGVILAKIEKLEAAAKHPDMGPVGDGLIALMDQKLSHLDHRLYELSSKITVANVQVPELKKQKPEAKTSLEKEEKIETEKKEIKKRVENIPEKPKMKIPLQNIEIDEKPKHPIEIITLTNLPSKSLDFPLIERKPIESKTEIINEISKSPESEPKMHVIQASLGSAELKLLETEAQKTQLQEQLAKPEPAKEIEKSKSIVNLPEDNDVDDDDDLDKIKGEIMKTLSKLQEAEVE